jgi:hypothetical protein
MAGVQGCCEGGRAGRIKARPGGGGAQNWGGRWKGDVLFGMKYEDEYA